MNKTALSILVVLVIFMNGHTQVQPIHPISSDPSDLVNTEFIQLNKTERIELEPLYDKDFTYFPTSVSYVGLQSLATNDSIASENTVHYSHTCHVDPLKIIDSIDINNDGVKELFVYRQSNCYVTSPFAGPYGVGNQRVTYGSYEVWDLKLKKKLVEIKNIRQGQIAVSTNVMDSFGYHFDVTITKKGVFHISGLTDGSDYVPGTYSYNVEKGILEKE